MDLHEIIHRTYMNNCLFPDMLKYSDYGAVLKRKLKQIHKIREIVKGLQEDQIDKIQPNHIKQLNENDVDEYIWYNYKFSNDIFCYMYDGTLPFQNNKNNKNKQSNIITIPKTTSNTNTCRYTFPHVIQMSCIWKHLFINTKDTVEIRILINESIIYSIRTNIIKSMQKLLNMTKKFQIDENTTLTELPINIFNEGMYDLPYSQIVLELVYPNIEIQKQNAQTERNAYICLFEENIRKWITIRNKFNRILLQTNYNKFNNLLCDESSGIRLDLHNPNYYLIIITSAEHKGEFYLNFNNNYCPLIKHSQEKYETNGITYIQIVSLTDNLSGDSLKEYGINLSRIETIQLHSTLPINILEIHSLNSNILTSINGNCGVVYLS
jgi:hypothetical protein